MIVDRLNHVRSRATVQSTILLASAIAFLVIAPLTACAQSNADLVDVSTTVVDGVGQYRLAASQHHLKAQLHDRQIVSEGELEEPRIRLETAELQLNLLRDIPEAEGKTAEMRADEFVQLQQSGRSAVSPAEIAATRFRMNFNERLLQLVDEQLKTAVTKETGGEQSAAPK